MDVHFLIFKDCGPELFLDVADTTGEAVISIERSLVTLRRC